MTKLLATLLGVSVLIDLTAFTLLYRCQSRNGLLQEETGGPVGGTPLAGSPGYLDEQFEKIHAIEAKAGVVNLLNKVDPKKDSVSGSWVARGNSLVCVPGNLAGQASRLQLPYLAPKEYDLTFLVETKDWQSGLLIGLTHGEQVFDLLIDGFPNEGFKSGIEMIGGKGVSANESVRPGLLIKPNIPTIIRCSVRDSGVQVRINGSGAIDWQGEFEKLTLHPVNHVPNMRALFVGSWSGTVRFLAILVEPVSETGKLLR